MTFANIEMGAGINSAHSGRTVTTLSLGVNSGSVGGTFFTSGTQSTYSYQSTYALNIYKIKKAGDLIGGVVNFGYGFGGSYSKHGLKDLNATESVTKSDFVLGPSLRLNWILFKHLYINMEGIYGLRGLFSHLALNFQDVVFLGVGVVF